MWSHVFLGVYVRTFWVGFMLVLEGVRRHFETRRQSRPLRRVYAVLFTVTY